MATPRRRREEGAMDREGSCRNESGYGRLMSQRRRKPMAMLGAVMLTASAAIVGSLLAAALM
jgi:hypothetical protein